MSVNIPKARYVGGHPGMKRSNVTGNLIVKEGVLGIGTLSPKHAKVNLTRGAQVRFESATAAKSRAGKVVAFGVLGLGARNTQQAAYMTVTLKSGAATFEVLGMSGPELAAKLRGELAGYGVTV